MQIEDLTSATHHFWITEPIADHHPLKVDLHFGRGVVFVDVVGNGRNVLPCIRLSRDREKIYEVTTISQMFLLLSEAIIAL